MKPRNGTDREMNRKFINASVSYTQGKSHTNLGTQNKNKKPFVHKIVTQCVIEGMVRVAVARKWQTKRFLQSKRN